MLSFHYYKVSLPVDTSDAQLLEYLTDTVMNICSFEYEKPYHAMVYDTYTPEQGMQFIYVHETDHLLEVLNALRDALPKDLISELSVEPIKFIELTPTQQKKVHCRRLSEPCIFEHERWRLPVRTREMLLEEIKNLPGFSEFKTFFYDLDRYLQHTAAVGRPGNYNVLLVNKSGIDEMRFINFIYDLYSAYGVIIQPMIRYEAEWRHELFKNTSYLCWMGRYALRDAERKRPVFERALQKLAVQGPVRILSVEEDLYQHIICPGVAERNAASRFSLTFAHVVTLDCATQEDKLAYLEQGLKAYGLEVALSTFQDSPILQMPVMELRACVTKAATRALYRQEGTTHPITVNDLLSHTL